MPDPNWTIQYNMANTPTNNGFSIIQQSGSPVINPVTSGSPANRRLEIDSTNGSVVYAQDSEPTTFDASVGVTGEIDLAVDGGNCGIEFTFLDRALLLDIQSNQIILYSPGGAGEVIHPIDMTVRRLLRVTLDTNQDSRVYVDNDPTPVLGPHDCPVVNKPARRFLFWAEGFGGTGGLSTIRGMRFYDGGPVVPG